MRVLVVENEQGMAESLTWELHAEGYVVDVANNGDGSGTPPRPSTT